MFSRESSFWQYKFCADILGVLWTGGVERQWVVENSDFFSAFGRYIFGSFRNKANVII